MKCIRCLHKFSMIIGTKSVGLAIITTMIIPDKHQKATCDSATKMCMIAEQLSLLDIYCMLINAGYSMRSNEAFEQSLYSSQLNHRSSTAKHYCPLPTNTESKTLVEKQVLLKV